METSMVAAVVILYNPDLTLLDRLVKSVLGQVEIIYVVDNTPEPSATIVTLLNQFAAPIIYRPLGDNLGIAFAQNFGIREAMGQGYTHVLLLDQDSCLPPHMVDQLLIAEADLLRAGREVAAVGPVFIDEKTGKRSDAIRHRFLRVDRIVIDSRSIVPVQSDQLIASGSLIRASTFQSVGLMLDDLFIDWVDIEWCLRAQSQGFESYIVPTAIMMHSIGDDTVRVLGRDINLHSDLRNYYMVRNAAYLLQVSTMRHARAAAFSKVIKYFIFYSFYSEHRRKNIALLWRALWDGIRGRLGKYQGADN